MRAMNKKKTGGVIVRTISAFSFIFWSIVLILLIINQFRPAPVATSYSQLPLRSFIVTSLFILSILVMSFDTMFGNYFLKKSFSRQLNQWDSKKRKR